MQHNAGGTLSHLSAQTIKNTHTHTAVAEKGGGIVRRGGRDSATAVRISLAIRNPFSGDAIS